MTQEELDALPEDGRFGARIEERDGKRYRIPVLETVGVLWSEDHEPTMVTDSLGVRWRVGRGSYGVMYKRRLGTV